MLAGKRMEGVIKKVVYETMAGEEKRVERMIDEERIVEQGVVTEGGMKMGYPIDGKESPIDLMINIGIMTALRINAIGGIGSLTNTKM